MEKSLQKVKFEKDFTQLSKDPEVQKMRHNLMDLFHEAAGIKTEDDETDSEADIQPVGAN